MNEMHKPEWLQRQLGDLPRELNTPRDLWPGIAARMERKRTHAWIPAAVAASLVLSVVSALFSWYLLEQRRDEAAYQLQISQMLNQIESPYQATLANFRTQWPQTRERLDPQTATVIEENLRVIREANARLQKALENKPYDPVVQELIRRTLSAQIDVYKRAESAAIVAI